MAFNNPFIPPAYSGYFGNGYTPSPSMSAPAATAPIAAPPPPPPQPQANNGLIWVQGEAAARSYLVAPSSTVLLMDSDASRFYLKSADASGMPSIRIFEYKETTFGNTAEQPKQNYITRDEYNALLEQVNRLTEKVEKPKNKKGASEDAESTV